MSQFASIEGDYFALYLEMINLIGCKTGRMVPETTPPAQINGGFPPRQRKVRSLLVV